MSRSYDAAGFVNSSARYATAPGRSGGGFALAGNLYLREREFDAVERVERHLDHGKGLPKHRRSLPARCS